MQERVAEIGKVTQSMCESVRRALEVLPAWCPEMRDTHVVTLGPFQHFDAWSPEWSEKQKERKEGLFKFTTTAGFTGRADFAPKYPNPKEMTSPGLLDGTLMLNLDRHEATGFPGRYYEIACHWTPHLQKQLLTFVYAGTLPPMA